MKPVERTGDGAGKAYTSVQWIVLILVYASASACSTVPDVTGDIKDTAQLQARGRVARVEQPAGVPGNVGGAEQTLEGQQRVLQEYRDGLYAALTTALIPPLHRPIAPSARY